MLTSLYGAIAVVQLAFEVLYNFVTADYSVFMDMQQRINMTIYERFQRQGIEFAIPAQRVILDGDRPGGKPTPATS